MDELPDLDDLVDLRHMDGRASPFELLHEMEEHKATHTGGVHMPQEPHRVGLLRSRDVLQVSLSCGSFGGSQQEDSIAWGSMHGVVEMLPHDHHAAGVREAASSRPRVQPYGLVQPLAPPHTSAAAPGPITSFTGAQATRHFHSGLVDYNKPIGSRLQPRALSRGPSSLGAPQPPPPPASGPQPPLPPPPQPPPPPDALLRGYKVLPAHLRPAGRARMGRAQGSRPRAPRPRSRARAQPAALSIPVPLQLTMPRFVAAPRDSGSDSHQSSGEFCYICHQYYSDSNLTLEQPGGEMLLCDGCDKGWHQFCLSPPVLNIPTDDQPWFCPVCMATKAQLADALATSLPHPGEPAPVDAVAADVGGQAGPSARHAQEDSGEKVEVKREPGSHQQQAQPGRKRTHSSSQGAVTGLQGGGGDGAVVEVAGAAAAQETGRGSGDTTSSNVSAAVKAEVVEDSIVEESPPAARPTNIRGSLRRRMLAAPTPPGAAHAAAQSPDAPAKATPAASSKREVAGKTTASTAPRSAKVLPNLVRPERVRKYGAVGKQALRLTNFVGRTFFGLGAHCMSCEVPRAKVEVDGRLQPDVYEGARIVLDNTNSSPRLINFGGRHEIGVNYDCGMRREADGTVVFLLSTKEPNTDKWASETAAAIRAVGGATPRDTSPQAGQAEAAQPRKRARNGAAAAAPASPQPPPPAAVAVAAAAGLVRPQHPRQLVTEHGRKPWVTRAVFDALWPGVGESAETELDLIVDGVTTGLRRAAKLKAGEPGRVNVTGVTWQEAQDLWDAGMQRLGPNLVALYASRTAPGGAATGAAAGAAGAGAEGAAGGKEAAGSGRSPKRARKGDVAAPRGLGVQHGARLRAALARGGAAPASMVQGAAGSSAPAVERMSTPQDVGASADGAEGGSGVVTMAHMEKGGALLMEIGQALELSGTQRMAAMRTVYSLSKDPVKLGLLLCMGLPHVKAEIDAGRKEDARGTLKELMPDIGL